MRATDRLRPPLAAERLEGRALLAVTASLSGGDLLISYNDATDVLAELVSDGTNYTVSGTGLSATQFPLSSVTGRIGVTDAAAIGGQIFAVLAGSTLANPLQVAAAIETTNLIAGINATRAGDVIIDSPSVSVRSTVSTSATNGNVTFSGAVTLIRDTAFTSGSGTITLGSVSYPGALLLRLGDSGQTGSVTITGNVSLPTGFLYTSASAFDLSIEGGTNSVRFTQFRNAGSLRIGRAGGTSTFQNGILATTQAAVSLAGVVETVNSTLQTGDVTLLADTTLRSGSGLIQTGAVTDGASALTLSLGSTTQTGEITLGGNVTLDGLTTAVGNFAVSLFGAANDITRQTTFTNTSYVAFGDDTNDVSRFAGGVTATSQSASNFLIGTVRTAGTAVDLLGAYLAGLATLDTSDAGANASGAPITLRNGVRLESHVLTTIGGVGQAASATHLLGTGAFGSGTADNGSLVVQAGSLFIGLNPSDTAALTIANDTTIQVTAGSLHVTDGSTIDATGASLSLLADDITIPSAAGSIDATRVTIAPVSAGRNIYVGDLSGSGLELGTVAFQAINADMIAVGRSGYSGTVAVGTLTLTDTTLSLVAAGTGGRVSLQGSLNLTGGLSIAAPQVTLAAVVLTEEPITISDGAGGDAAIVLGGNAVLDTTHENANPAGSGITIQGTVTASATSNYIFVLKGGTDGDVVVTNTIGVVGSGVSPGPVSVTGNDITIASVDRVNGGLFIEATDGTDAGSVRLTGTTYRVAGSIGIAAGIRDPVTNALTNVITLAGGATGATTTVVTSGADVELNGTVDLAGRTLSIDTTNAGGTPGGSTIWIYDSIDGGGALTLDSGTAGDILVNHLTGQTGATTPLTSITVTNAHEAGFLGNLKAGTVRIVDASVGVAFAGVLDITGGLVAEAQPYAVRLLGGNNGSSRIAGATTFQNTGALRLGDQGPSDVITFVGGLVATAPSELRLTASILAETGSIVLGDADTDATIVAAALIGGGATAITLADVILNDNAELVLGSGSATTMQLGSVTRASDGVAEGLLINTTGAVTVTGAVGGNGTVGSLALTSAATLHVTVTGLEPIAGYGRFAVRPAGTVDLGSAALTMTGSSPLPLGSALTIVDNGGGSAVSGTFAGLPEGTVFDSPVGTVRISYQGGDGNDVTLYVVSREIVAGIQDDYLEISLSGAGTTVRNLSTQYFPATNALVVTVAADRRLTGGGTGLTVNPKAGTVTVALAQLPQFKGIVVLGTEATDRITLGPRGVNLAAFAGGAASQAFVIRTGQGPDVVTIRSAIRTKGSDGGLVAEAGTINVGAAVNTQFGQQRYTGNVQLVGATSLTGGAIEFQRRVDGASRLTVSAAGAVGFRGTVGGVTPLRGLTIQQAGSVQSFFGMRLDGRGLGRTANGLVIGRGVGNVLIGTMDPVLSPCTISGFGGSGILFQGNSAGCALFAFTLAGNGRGISFLPGDYTATLVGANTISGNRQAGISLDGARNLAVGYTAAGYGNTIDGGSGRRPAAAGIVARGLLTGTRVMNNTIVGNGGSGIVLQSARDLVIGGGDESNSVIGNLAWGVLGSGDCIGSVLDTSDISDNRLGNVNVSRARGLVVIPPP